MRCDFLWRATVILVEQTIRRAGKGGGEVPSWPFSPILGAQWQRKGLPQGSSASVGLPRLSPRRSIWSCGVFPRQLPKPVLSPYVVVCIVRVGNFFKMVKEVEGQFEVGGTSLYTKTWLVRLSLFLSCPPSLACVVNGPSTRRIS